MSEQAKTDKKFDNLVTILIASVAILVSITAYVQNYTSNLSDQSRRRAQQNSIDATRQEVVGAIQYSYEWQGAFQAWSELDWQITSAEQNGDYETADRYRILQGRIIDISKLLNEEYFDPEYGWPELGRYEAETYLVESRRLSETYLAESEAGNFTDNIADGLIVQITLLTVALSLYGLSLALAGRVRWLFVIVGSGIVGVCMLWFAGSLYQILTRPTVNHDAIRAYAEGIGLSNQGRIDEAFEKFNLALSLKPDYAKAHYERGNLYYALEDYANAITEYETARSKGLDDISTNWNLGWTYYLTGQYLQAIEVNDHILQTHPEVLGVRMNQALTYLVMGDLVRSQEQYDILMSEAERQISEARNNGDEPPASLWYYMDASAIDLQNLVDRLEGNPKAWTEAPDVNQVNGDHNVIRDFAIKQMIRLKEATTALEYTGRLPSGETSAEVGTFVFGHVTGKDSEGYITDFEPASNGIISYGDSSFDVQFTYSGPPTSQYIWKVYRNGQEDLTLRRVSNQDLSEGDTWYTNFGFDYTNVFILADGEYRLELYIDNQLVQSGIVYIK
ncbi:MAG: tetratricopeptide repeat protein [Anaerolineales bacterium]|nr:tetratricopeptide repeat protein [Anaerolineales bacterium]